MSTKEDVEIYLYEIKQKALTTKLMYQLTINHIERHMEDYCKFNEQQLMELMNNHKKDIHPRVNSLLKKDMRNKYGINCAWRAVRGY